MVDDQIEQRDERNQRAQHREGADDAGDGPVGEAQGGDEDRCDGGRERQQPKE